MSLMQLLSVGRSLCGIKDGPPRYKMTQTNLVPNFGSKNLGKNGATFEPIQLIEAIRPMGQSGKPVERAESVMEPPISIILEAPVNSVNNIAAESEKPVRRSVFAVLGLKPLVSRKNPFTGLAAAKQLTEKGSVQGELSLDGVKVVRNDLSDADLEVVARNAQPPGPTSATPAEKPTEVHDSIGLAWGRISARILGAGRTR